MKRALDPFPLSKSPLHMPGRKRARPDLGEGCYDYDGVGAHDPTYYCTCDKYEGTHARAEDCPPCQSRENGDCAKGRGVNANV